MRPAALLRGLARRGGTTLLILAVALVATGAAAAGPISSLVLGHVGHATQLFLIALLGLWSFTNLELAYALLRIDERTRAYATAALVNVGITIVAAVVLVVVLRLGARGIILGNYGASTLVLVALWWTYRRRLSVRTGSAERLPVLMRFGLPTVPAEASVYALNIVDRYYIYHHLRHGLLPAQRLAARFEIDRIGKALLGPRALLAPKAKALRRTAHQ